MLGVFVETIMQRHNESVEKQGSPMNRDDLLTHRYVQRQERSIWCSTYELDPDDAICISMWVEIISHVFFHQDFSYSDPFTLGIQTNWQLQQMECVRVLCIDILLACPPCLAQKLSKELSNWRDGLTVADIC